MRIEDMTPEQIEQVKKCETPEEGLAFIKESGVELTDEQLENVAGGSLADFSCWIGIHCWKRTGNTKQTKDGPAREYYCENCGKREWMPD